MTTMKTKTKSMKPKKCGHCGIKPVISIDGNKFFLVCTNCHRITTGHNTKQATIAEWNEETV